MMENRVITNRIMDHNQVTFDCDKNLDPFDRLLHGSGHLGLRALAWVAGHEPALRKKRVILNNNIE